MKQGIDDIKRFIEGLDDETLKEVYDKIHTMKLQREMLQERLPIMSNFIGSDATTPSPSKSSQSSIPSSPSSYIKNEGHSLVRAAFTSSPCSAFTPWTP